MFDPTIHKNKNQQTISDLFTNTLMYFQEETILNKKLNIIKQVAEANSYQANTINKLIKKHKL